MSLTLKYSRPKRLHVLASGFTIIELLVATMVFSTILILLIFTVIQINNEYEKGLIATNTQDVARNIINTISQAFQFDGGIFSVGSSGSSAGLGGTGGSSSGLGGSSGSSFGGSSSSSGSSSGLGGTGGSSGLGGSGGGSSFGTGSGGSGPSWFCIGNQVFSYNLGLQLTDSSSPSTDQTNVGLLQTPDQVVCPAKASDLPTSGTELLSPNMRLSALSITTPQAGVYQIHVQVTYGDFDLLNNPTAPNASCIGGAGDQFCAVASLTTIVQQRINSQ